MKLKIFFATILLFIVVNFFLFFNTKKNFENVKHKIKKILSEIKSNPNEKKLPNKNTIDKELIFEKKNN